MKLLFYRNPWNLVLIVLLCVIQRQWEIRTGSFRHIQSTLKTINKQQRIIMIDIMWQYGCESGAFEHKSWVQWESEDCPALTDTVTAVQIVCSNWVYHQLRDELSHKIYVSQLRRLTKGSETTADSQSQSSVVSCRYFEQFLMKWSLKPNC